RPSRSDLLAAVVTQVQPVREVAGVHGHVGLAAAGGAELALVAGLSGVALALDRPGHRVLLVGVGSLGEVGGETDPARTARRPPHRRRGAGAFSSEGSDGGGDAALRADPGERLDLVRAEAGPVILGGDDDR